MIFYKHLFYILFSFLKSFEGGFSYQTDNYRALEVAILIGFLELFNVMSLFPLVIVGRVAVWPLIFLVGLNYLIFCFGDRYKMIVVFFKKEKVSLVYRVITILYVVATFVFFGITR